MVALALHIAIHPRTKSHGQIALPVFKSFKLLCIACLFVFCLTLNISLLIPDKISPVSVLLRKGTVITWHRKRLRHLLWPAPRIELHSRCWDDCLARLLGPLQLPIQAGRFCLLALARIGQLLRRQRPFQSPRAACKSLTHLADDTGISAKTMGWHNLLEHKALGS